MKRWHVYWGLFCIVACAVLVYIIGHNRQYSGTDVTMTTSSWDLIEVTAKREAKVEAASSSLFMLTRPDGETLAGYPERSVPLGWGGSKYIVLKPTQISGRWDVEVGNGLTMHFTSDGDMDVVRSLKTSSLITLMLVTATLVFIFWLMVVLATYKDD